MRKIGKIGKRNLNALETLKWFYNDYGITSCELGLDGCMGNQFMGFAHKEKRENYRKNPEGLADFNETLLLCQNCHSILDDRSKTTKEQSDAVFKSLRPIQLEGGSL